MMEEENQASSDHRFASRMYEGYVEHKRLQPREHAFRYNVCFYGFDLDDLNRLDRTLPLFGYNRLRPTALFDRDYLDEGDESIRSKVQKRLADEPFASEIARIYLITAPRYFNYVFNPVSFYYVCSASGDMLCVLTEVNNTFGEKHLYVLKDPKRSERTNTLLFEARKVFHVSPFNTIEGDYLFSFSVPGDVVDISIELKQTEEILFQARLYGRALSLTAGNHIRQLVRHPLVSHLTMPRILFEAARLFLTRRLKYVEKPPAVHMMTLRRKGPTVFQTLCLNALRNIFSKIQTGSLTLQLPDNRLWRFGRDEGNRQAKIIVYDYAFFTKTIMAGDVGIGEAYTQGLWETSDIVALFKVFIANRRALADGYPATAWMIRQKNRVMHALRTNTPLGSRRNIKDHYDLGNAFFECFLDSTLLYSCGLYGEAADTCEDAQLRKIAVILKKADIGPGDHVLEIGCGWGGFAVEAVKRTGCRVTGITVSRAQYNYATERIRQAGLQDRITIRLCDYRHIDGQYDKIVSIEMLEAVGHQYFGAYFSACNRALKPGGRAVIQTITIPDQSYDDYRRETDWIQKHIFPGGHLPSVTELLKAATKSSSLLVEHLEDIGPHYARTLRDWRDQFVRHTDKIEKLGFDESFRRKWIYYLSMCEAGFSERVLGDVQMVFRKPG